MKSLTIFLSLLCLYFTAPLTLNEATERSKSIDSIIHYQTVLLLPKGKYYTGYTQISFKIKKSSNLFLDFNGDSIFDVKINGEQSESLQYNSIYAKEDQPLSVSGHQNGKLTLDTSKLKFGSNEINTVIIGFKNQYSSDGNGLHSLIDNQNQQFIYCQNEPYWFNRIQPIVDQPDIKGVMKFMIITPNEWKVVSNAPLEKEQPIEGSLKNFIDMINYDDKMDATNYKISFFEETQILPSYLFNFVAGDFYQIDYQSSEPVDEVTTGDLKIFVTASLSKYAEAQKEDIFKVMITGLRFYNNYFNHINQQKKLALIFCPEFSTGAMEYPGAITINDNYIFKIDNPKPSSLFSRANTILHELAHLWFGDTVTMAWWEDLWLNESFATFMSYLAMDELKGTLNYKDMNVQLDFASDKSWGYNEDILSTTHPISHTVNNTDEAKNAFDGITYAKGAAILHMIHKRINEDPNKDDFRTKINEYIKKYVFSNATFNEFVNILSMDKESIDNDFKQWIKDWVATSGVNTLSIVYKDSTSVTIQQNTSGEEKKLREHRINLSCYFLDNNSLTEAGTNIVIENKDSTTVNLVNEIPMNSCEAFILNSNGENYVRTKLDDESRKFLFENFSSLPNYVTNFIVIRSEYDSVLDIERDPREFLDNILSLNFTNISNQLFELIMEFASSILFTYIQEKEFYIYARKLFESIEGLIEGILKEELKGFHHETIFNSLLLFAVNNDQIESLKPYLDYNLNNKLKVENISAEKKYFDLSILQMYRIIFKLAATNTDFAFDDYLTRMRSLDASDMNNQYRIAIDHVSLKDISSRNAAWDKLKTNSEKLSHTKIKMALLGFFSILVDKDLRQPYYDNFISDGMDYIKNMPYSLQMDFINSSILFDDRPDIYIKYFTEIVDNKDISAGITKKAKKLRDIMTRRKNIFENFNEHKLRFVL